MKDSRWEWWRKLPLKERQIRVAIDWHKKEIKSAKELLNTKRRLSFSEKLQVGNMRMHKTVISELKKTLNRKLVD